MAATPALAQQPDLLTPDAIPVDLVANQVDANVTLPRTLALIRDGIAQGLHIGAQLYVSLKRELFADAALGWARPGVPMTPDTLMIWYSATKPVTAAALAQLWEQGKLRLDDPVAVYLPEFAENAKERITIRQILTHTSCFPLAANGVSGQPWDQILAQIAAAPLSEGCTPGQTAIYHPASGWYVLGEIINRITRTSLSTYLGDEIFAPLGLLHCWVGMSPERYQSYGERIGWMHDTNQGPPQRTPNVDTAEACAQTVPGGNGRGPMRQLAQFYEALMLGGSLDGVRILHEPTVEALVSPHRVAATTPDGNPAPPWGLGFALDALAFGPYCSPRTFGHGGSRSSLAFCDPVHRLVAAVVFNGRPSPEAHARRMAAFAQAVYEDIGLTAQWRDEKATPAVP